ncbi:MAG: lytic murein transglycosylase [Paracoccaceae bacterium]|nr:lytic murein transglycosylase [Paracoccaceae bacterium]
MRLTISPVLAFPVLALLALSAPGAEALVPCGGPFPAFVQAMKAEAVAQGHNPAAVERFFAGVENDEKVLQADQAQGVFRKTFTDFSRMLISKSRYERGIENGRKYAGLFARADQSYGVPKGILLAFWAFETDYGSFQGNFNTRNALVTLAHNCRRPDIFQPQVLAALSLFEKGEFDPLHTTGAWAGEIGMVQMLPKDILERGVDGDGDGKVSLKTSVPDAILSAAHMLQTFGWKPHQPWMVEVKVPAQMDWVQTGLETRLPVSKWAAMGVKPRSGAWPGGDLAASILLPQGRKGPAFMVFDNFRVLTDWNKSRTYDLTIAYFAMRMEGAPVFDPGHPDPELSLQDTIALQKGLLARGYTVGKVDGILGAATRAAVRAEQSRLGLPADGWPTRALLERL